MHNIRSLLVSFTVILFFANSASAVMTSIDADGFSDGTILNDVFSDVTLSAFGSSTDGNVYARTSSLATTGTKVFGNSSVFDPLWIPGGRSLRVDFSWFTDFVSIDFIANDTDRGTFEIFNSSNVSLGLLTTNTLNAGVSQTLSFDRSGVFDIAYMTATGYGGDNLALDNIIYNAVPEPTTMLLFGTGLAALAAVSRRRK